MSLICNALYNQVNNISKVKQGPCIDHMIPEIQKLYQIEPDLYFLSHPWPVPLAFLALNTWTVFRIMLIGCSSFLLDVSVGVKSPKPIVSKVIIVK